MEQIAALFLLGFATLSLTYPLPAGSKSDGTDTYYKAQCVKCHGDRAELKFDPKMAPDEMVKTILKGKLVEDPPDMPAFGDKGMTTEQARALANYMTLLRKND